LFSEELQGTILEPNFLNIFINALYTKVSFHTFCHFFRGLKIVRFLKFIEVFELLQFGIH
jgi:hypothetical protein